MADDHPPIDADCPESEINTENLDNVDVRFSTFDENYPAWVMLGQVRAPDQHGLSKREMRHGTPEHVSMVHDVSL